MDTKTDHNSLSKNWDARDSRASSPSSALSAQDNTSSSERRTVLPSLGVSIPNLLYSSGGEPHSAPPRLFSGTPNATAFSTTSVLPPSATIISPVSAKHRRDPIWANSYSSRSPTSREFPATNNRHPVSSMDILQRQRQPGENSHVYHFPDPSHHYSRSATGYGYPASSQQKQHLPSPLALELPHAPGGSHGYYPTLPPPPSEMWGAVAIPNSLAPSHSSLQPLSQSLNRTGDGSKESSPVDNLSSMAVKKKRKRADAYQLSVLNGVYARTAFPSTEERKQLAEQLDMTPRSVQIWFQNKRQANRQNKQVTSPSTATGGSPDSSASPSGPPAAPPASIPPAVQMHNIDSYGRPTGSGRPPPLLQSNMHQGDTFSSSSHTSGYSSSYRGSMGNVGVSDYTTLPPVSSVTGVAGMSHQAVRNDRVLPPLKYENVPNNYNPQMEQTQYQAPTAEYRDKFKNTASYHHLQSSEHSRHEAVARVRTACNY